jgi:hypothetical protein
VIVAETPETYRLVTQPDHASLAGDLADRWGGGSFETPTPRASVALSAHEHDAGWRAYDRRPRLGPEGAPRTFTEVPPAEWIDLYTAGIDAVADLNPYAGLLVSLHGAGLRRRRYGLSPEWSDTPDAFEAFVEREEARQDRLADRLAGEAGGDDGPLSTADRSLLSTLHETGSPPAGVESRLWRNYALLQAWDSFSLLLCARPDLPEREVIERVPTAPGNETTLHIRAVGDGQLALDPYPFRTTPVTLTVPVRHVPRRTDTDEDALLRAYYEAPRETLSVTLRPAGD